MAIDKVEEIRCAKSYCDRAARYYVEEVYQETDYKGRKIEVKGMKVGYCADHAPEGAKLIEKV